MDLGFRYFFAHLGTREIKIYAEPHNSLNLELKTSAIRLESTDGINIREDLIHSHHRARNE